MVNLLARPEPPVVPVKGELGSGLGALVPVGEALGASPVTILHSLSGGRSIQVVSTGFKGRVGTSHKTLEARATPCPPGTFPPSASTVEIRSDIEL